MKTKSQPQGGAAEAELSPHVQARILAEALPHLIRYDDQTVVIKFGGHAMVDAALADAFAQDVVYLKQSGVNPIVVHGGGPQIAAMLKKLHITSDFVHGLRVTDKTTVEVVEMVLAGQINKDIVSAINRQGGKAVGICGKDANLMIARKITEMPDPESNVVKAVDIGYVGEPVEVNPHIVEVISGSDLIPVIAPIGVSREGETLNINADTFASALAARMKAKRLLLLTDVEGVLDKNKELVHELSIEEARAAHQERRHLGRHDPQDRRLHRGGRSRRRRRRHHRRARAPLRAARAVHHPRRRHARVQRAAESAGAAQMTVSGQRRALQGTEQSEAAKSKRGFADTATWIFDLDNTLYPAQCNLFAEVDRRMGKFIAEYLDVPFEHARYLQKTYYRQFGTTLTGLMQVHKLEPQASSTTCTTSTSPPCRSCRSWRPRWRRCPAAGSSSPTARAATPSASPRSSASSTCSRISATSPPANTWQSPPPTPSTAWLSAMAWPCARPPCSRTCRTTSRPRTRSA